MKTVTVELHQHDNGTWTLMFDKRIRGDSRPFTSKSDAHDMAMHFRSIEGDGGWEGSKWVNHNYYYRMPVTAGQCEAMSQNDNS